MPPTLAEIRTNYPQYSTLSDDDLAGALQRKFYPNMPREEFNQRVGLKTGPTEPVTVDNVVRSAARGVPIVGGLIDKANAATNAALAPMLNPLFDPKDQLQEPTWGERYDHSLRDQQRVDEAFDRDHPVVSTGAKIGGGIAATLPLAATATGARLLGLTAETLPGQIAAGGASNAVIGGADAAVRGEDPLTGAAVGGVLGAALPAVAAGAKLLATPFVSNFRARVNPEGYAESQVARALKESKQTPSDVVRGVTDAAQEGQGVFTLADSMGNSGQRMLSTVTRSPGEGRTMAVQALDARQGDQGRRLATSLREGFEAPQTAEATRDAMSAQANFEAGHNYAPVRRETAPIDVSPPVAIANRSISPAADNLAMAQGAVPTDLAARAGIERSESALRDPIGNALKEARSYLAAPTLTSSNVNQAFRAKVNIDVMIAKAVENKQGELVSHLTPIKNALDEALAATSSNYAHARDSYRIAQQRINALDLGKVLGSKPGRPEDAIRQFGALPDAEAQQAFRAGYVDPQISQVQNAAFGTNKARPLTSDAVSQEFAAFAAPGRADQLNRQIGREQTMFETRNQAMGGSRTADNLADDAAMAVDPSMIAHVVSGNYGAALKSALHGGYNMLTGNTPAVREEVAKILLQRGNVPPAALEQMLDHAMQRVENVQRVARHLIAAGRATGNTLVTSAAQKNQQ